MHIARNTIQPTATAGALAWGALAVSALPAGVIGVSATASSSSSHIRPGQIFDSHAHLFHGVTNLASQNVERIERSGPTQHWNKATNTPAALETTDANGNVRFAVTGLSRIEQFTLYHPARGSAATLTVPPGVPSSRS
jgi:hypothetical protein